MSPLSIRCGIEVLRPLISSSITEEIDDDEEVEAPDSVTAPEEHMQRPELPPGPPPGTFSTTELAESIPVTDVGRSTRQRLALMRVHIIAHESESPAIDGAITSSLAKSQSDSTKAREVLERMDDSFSIQVGGATSAMLGPSLSQPVSPLQDGSGIAPLAVQVHSDEIKPSFPLPVAPTHPYFLWNAAFSAEVSPAPVPLPDPGPPSIYQSVLLATESIQNSSPGPRTFPQTPANPDHNNIHASGMHLPNRANRGHTFDTSQTHNFYGNTLPSVFSDFGATNTDRKWPSFGQPKVENEEVIMRDDYQPKEYTQAEGYPNEQRGPLEYIDRVDDRQHLKLHVKQPADEEWRREHLLRPNALQPSPVEWRYSLPRLDRSQASVPRQWPNQQNQYGEQNPQVPSYPYSQRHYATHTAGHYVHEKLDPSKNYE